jgi:hypothetical protein
VEVKRPRKMQITLEKLFPNFAFKYKNMNKFWKEKVRENIKRKR